MTAYVSAFDLFSIGIGPSSSHTVGPMRAALDFVTALKKQNLLSSVTSANCSLYGSLGSTGIGHGTPGAVIAGLTGLAPETCMPEQVRSAWSNLETDPTLNLGGSHSIAFSADDITFEPRTRLPGHPNAMTIRAFGADALPLLEQTYYSVGGGFIRRDGEEASTITT
ncbi:MAG: serine dehydratase beta chain, partial [Aurantimicrobium sp.]